MPEFQKNCTVITGEQPARGLLRLRLAAPEIAAAVRPGQFVMVACGADRDPLLRRPLSVHNAEAGATIDLLVRVLGRGTAALARLRAGDTLPVLGPLGRGFGEAQEGAEVLLVGGGIGCAPLLLLARRLLARRARPVLLLGAAHAAEARAFRDCFQGLDCPVHLSTDDGSLGYHGFVTGLLPELAAAASRVYACGPMPMMAAVARFCGSRLPCEVSLESRMACGLGACLGCAVPAPDRPGAYRHVCKDGPVFPANEVLWP